MSLSIESFNLFSSSINSIWENRKLFEEMKEFRLWTNSSQFTEFSWHLYFEQMVKFCYAPKLVEFGLSLGTLEHLGEKYKPYLGLFSYLKLFSNQNIYNTQTAFPKLETSHYSITSFQPVFRGLFDSNERDSNNHKFMTTNFIFFIKVTSWWAESWKAVSVECERATISIQFLLEETKGGYFYHSLTDMRLTKISKVEPYNELSDLKLPVDFKSDSIIYVPKSERILV